jgi:hypothetical protein
MEFSGCRDESAADMTKRGEHEIKGRCEERFQHPESESEIRIDHQHSQISETRLPIDDSRNPAESVRGIAVTAETGAGTRGVKVEAPSVRRCGPVFDQRGHRLQAFLFMRPENQFFCLRHTYQTLYFKTLTDFMNTG